MHARSSSCRLAGACTALLALALLGTPAAAAKAASGSHPARVAGTVSAVDTTAGTVTITPRHGGPVTLTTDAQTRLSLNGEPAKLADIPVGGAARAVYDPATKLARRIEVRSAPSLAAVAGKVTAVSGSSLTIAPEEGSPVTLGTDAATKIVVDGATATLSAIAVGDQARALYDSTTLVAAAIEAESPHHQIAEIEGQVTAVTASSLTIMPEEGAPVTLGTDASTVVILDGAPSKLAAIAVGDKARALYDSGTLIAIAIQAQSPHHELAAVEGQVTAVGGSSITITPEEQGAAAVTLGTSSATQIFLDGAVSSLSAIAVGDRAGALYDSSTLIAIVVAAEKPSGD
jgi:Domain of unknown function (DUF5666)